MKLLPMLLRRVIRAGSLTLTGPNGYSETFKGDMPGPEVTIRINDPSLDRKLMLNPELRARYNRARMYTYAHLKCGHARSIHV